MLHLGIINACALKLAPIWAARPFLVMCVFVVTLTGAVHMLTVFAVSALLKGYQMTSPPATLNCIVAIILLGVRQNFYESKLVTPIPFYDSTLKIPFKVCSSM